MNVFAALRGDVATAAITLRGLELHKLTEPDGSPLQHASPLSVTWESAAECLEALPRMIFEPDGSFVWSGEVDGSRWQVDGHLFEFTFDGLPWLHRLQLHGHCPRETFEELLASVGWPAAPLLFELVMEGVTLDEADFRRWAAATPAG